MIRMVTGKDKGTSDVEKSEKAATVLVADDDASVRTFIRTALEQIGLKVGEASNGAEALQQFEALRPDIIVLDVMMPVMDGYVACSRLRGSVHGSCLPILMMTGLDDVAAAYEHGATDFITKPLNLTILSHRVRYMLRGAGRWMRCCAVRPGSDWLSGLRRSATGNGSHRLGNSPPPRSSTGSWASGRRISAARWTRSLTPSMTRAVTLFAVSDRPTEMR